MSHLSDHLAQPHLRIPRLSRLGWLMGLYAENFRRMERLFGLGQWDADHYRSSIGDGLDVCMDVLERAPYTTRLRLTYAELSDPVSGQPEPSAWLRLYHDSRQLEATHCYLGRGWQDVIGFNPTAMVLMEHRLRMNTFLGKWLQYLGECGHQRTSLHLMPGQFETPVE